MTPALIVWYLIMMVPFASRGPWTAGIDIAVGIASILVTWAVSNLARGHRPFDRAITLGPGELAVFLLVPPLMNVALGIRQPLDGIEAGVLLGLTFVLTFLLQVGMLALIWVVTYFGLAALGAWISREVIGSLGDVGVALARTVPLLIVVVTFFFFTGEVWQSVGQVEPVGYVGIIALFVLVSAVFLASRWQLDIDQLAAFHRPEDLRDTLARRGIPAELAAVTVPAEGYPRSCPLSRPQQRNLRFVAGLSRLVVASLVGSWVFWFFILLGFLAVDGDTVRNWTQGTPLLITRIELFGHPFALTWEHLKVAGFLAVFTGFYFAVVSATDATLREGLRDTAEDAVREACAARIAVLLREAAALRDRTGGPPTAGDLVSEPSPAAPNDPQAAPADPADPAGPAGPAGPEASPTSESGAPAAPAGPA